VNKHRELTSIDVAYNARIDDDTYHRRSVVESVFASLRRRFDDTIRARTWFGQFREIILKAAVKNIEDAIKL
jgi:IS5 family transposase